VIPKIMTHLYTCGRSNENEAHLPVFSFDTACKMQLKRQEMD